MSAVICETAAPYFLRNSIERGLPIVELHEILKAVKQGEELEVNLERGHLTNLSSGVELKFEPTPPFILERLDAGGMIPFLKNEVEAGRIPSVVSLTLLYISRMLKKVLRVTLNEVKGLMYLKRRDSSLRSE